MRLTFGYQVLVAVVAGALAGLFFGPLTTYFRPIGTIYAMLLQMVVLPYICLSIIMGLGSLTPAYAKNLFKNGCAYWILLWSLIFFFIYLFSQMIPRHVVGSFLQPPPSAGVIREALAKNILTYLVPENPIFDFLNNIIPAIAVFGMIVGFALMHIEKKEPLLSLVDKGDQILEKILAWLVWFSPIAVFANISVITGTVYLSDLIKIDFYIISYVFVTLIFTIWILPLILSSLTPLSFWESLRALGRVCLLSFFTGTVAISIPLINRYLRKLTEKEPFKGEAIFRTTIQTTMPISYSFAQIGNAFILFFMLFASFYYRHPFSSFEKSLLSFLTIPLSAGSFETGVNSVSFLLNEFKFPDSAQELFSATMPVTVNFQAFLSAASILTLILLIIFVGYPLMKFNWKILLFKLIGSIGVTAAVILAIRPFIHLEDNFRNLYENKRIADALKDPVKPKLYLHGEPLNYLSSIVPNEGVLVRIFRTRVLRVGYSPFNIPYAYWNQEKDLVGLDIAMAYQLAKDLNCNLEFVPMSFEHLDEELNNGVYDIAMSAVLITEDRIQKMSFTDAYTDQNNVLVISKSKKQQFASLEKAEENKQLIIVASGGYRRILAQNFPNRAAYHGPYDQELPTGTRDAWIWSLIPATIWCLSNPDFYVDGFNGQLGKSYFAYAMRTDALRMLGFVNNWMTLKNLDGFYQNQEEYWIYGKSTLKEREPRWSIIQNVLHWIN